MKVLGIADEIDMNVDKAYGSSETLEKVSSFCNSGHGDSAGQAIGQQLE